MFTLLVRLILSHVRNIHLECKGHDNIFLFLFLLWKYCAVMLAVNTNTDDRANPFLNAQRCLFSTWGLFGCPAITIQMNTELFALIFLNVAQTPLRFKSSYSSLTLTLLLCSYFFLNWNYESYFMNHLNILHLHVIFKVSENLFTFINNNIYVSFKNYSKMLTEWMWKWRVGDDTE